MQQGAGALNPCLLASQEEVSHVEMRVQNDVVHLLKMWWLCLDEASLVLSNIYGSDVRTN